MKNTSIIVATPDPDGLASAALAVRALGAECRVLLFESEKLPEFFAESYQRGLPPHDELVLCGHQLLKKDWDGRLIRPFLIESLRSLPERLKWFSATAWNAEDRAAVAHLIGRENLCVVESAPSVASLVYARLAGGDDEHNAALVKLAEGDASTNWVGGWRRVVLALKSDLDELSELIGHLAQGLAQQPPAELLQRAERVEKRNATFAKNHASEPHRMREVLLVDIDVPSPRHPFWSQISARARAEREAHFCLAQLVGRSVLILSRSPDSRAPLGVWMRYVTDMLPPAERLGTSTDYIPLFVDGLPREPALKRDVLALLEEGSHLLMST